MREPTMVKRNPLKQVESRLRKKALSYPETKEEFPWEHRAIKVKGKIFLILAMYEGKLGVTMKLPDSGKSALALPFTESTGYGLGKSGWVTSRFGPVDMVPLDMLMEWLDESYRAVAPKKVVAQLVSKQKAMPARHAASTRKQSTAKP
jgi:predicted DNA-binding protein (MmcQ/YjbR family)